MGLDDDDAMQLQLKYDDDDNIDPILEILLMKQIVGTIEAYGMTGDLAQSYYALCYSIIRMFSQTYPCMVLLSERSGVKQPLLETPLLPDQENTKLSELMDHVYIMNMYINIVTDPQ
jgi:hypothetical protein